MKTLYLIGNGFDANLGLETKYIHFYKYYTKVENKSESIDRLKANIENYIINEETKKPKDKDRINWADLELALGLYTEHINSEKEFMEIAEDVIYNLSSYLKSVEEKTDYSKFNKNLLLSHLSNPENALTEANRNKIRLFKNEYSAPIYVDIITFNYTNTLEKILNFNGVELKIGSHGSNGIFLNRIEHVHGFVNSRMVVGVNDISQIANKFFHDKIDVLETAVKDMCNKASGHTIESQCAKLISNANLICVFGSSLGSTDKIWWEKIGQRLKNLDCKLIVFDYGDPIPDLLPQVNAQRSREVINRFLNQTDLTDTEKESVKSNIVVGANTKLFKLLQT